MMIRNILNQLESNTIRRIDDSHILNIYVGKNLSNLPTILIRTQYEVLLPNSSKYIDINSDFNNDVHLYFFMLKDIVHLDMFIDIFTDISDYSRKTESEIKSLKMFVSRYILWSNLFIKPNTATLSTNLIIGIFGELLFLNNFLSKKIGMAESIKAGLHFHYFFKKRRKKKIPGRFPGIF